MPGQAAYENLSLPEQILRLAENHIDPRQRHISQAENSILQTAADALRKAGTTPDSGIAARGSVARVLVLVAALAGGGYVAWGKWQAKTAAPEKDIEVRGQVGQPVVITATGGASGEPTREIRGVLASANEQGLLVRHEDGQEELLVRSEIRAATTPDGRPIVGW